MAFQTNSLGTSKKAIVSSDTPTWSLLLAVAFSVTFEERNSDNITKLRQGLQIFIKLRNIKPPIHNGRTIWQSYLKNSPYLWWRNQLAECVPISPSCTLRQYASINEAYGLRYPKLQYHYVHFCGFLWCRKSLSIYTESWLAIWTAQCNLLGHSVPSENWGFFWGRINHTSRYTSRIFARLCPGPYLYILFINDTPEITGIYLDFFADYICPYGEEGDVLSKLQRNLTYTE